MAQKQRWSSVRLKNVCSESAVYGANIPADAYTDFGVRFIRTTDITEKGELRENGVYVPNHLVEDYILQDGDILLSRSGTVGRTFLYEAAKHGPCSYAGYLVKFKASQLAQPRFVNYCAQSDAFQSMVQEAAISSTIENVNATKYANFPIPLPPSDEQAAIVRFLDHADEQIRRYIAGKERLIALLEEERQALVHQAVTRGLDPNVRLKQSGVEWLGDVPEHWDLVRLGSTGRFSKGNGGTKEDEVPAGVPCVRYGDIYTSHKYFIRASRAYIETEKTSEYTPLRYGDILFAGSGETVEEIGKSAVNLIQEPTYSGGDVIIFRPTVELNAEFTGYATDSPAAQAQKSIMGRGFTVMHIYGNQLKNLQIALPPLYEQNCIVEHINQGTARIDEETARCRRQVDLMHEYRTRLIADVVTGQLDVRYA